MNKFTKWLKSFVFAEDEPISNQKNDSSVYINAYNNWAKIETSLPAEKNAQVKKAVDEIVKAVFEEK
ncbi:MAG: hypothetical protein K2M82_04525 [Lachnospiraceae bacterium]|nr:hypothetical protein [Lachnospiraceae bacterium]